MNLNEYESKIIAWSESRGLLAGTTVDKQFKKFIEELGEFSKALMLEDSGGVVDGIGDMIVVLINMCAKMGISLEQCMEVAWDEIKDRKGEMINGTFVKDSPL